MKTMISVNSTSISGVTLISGPRAPPPASENDIGNSFSHRWHARVCNIRHLGQGESSSSGDTSAAKASRRKRTVNAALKRCSTGAGALLRPTIRSVREQMAVAEAVEEEAAARAWHSAPVTRRDKELRSVQDSARRRSKWNTRERTR